MNDIKSYIVGSSRILSYKVPMKVIFQSNPMCAADAFLSAYHNEEKRKTQFLNQVLGEPWTEK